MPKICDMNRVREYAEGYTVELWKEYDTGRFLIVARNENGQNDTMVDLVDVLNWLRRDDGKNVPRDIAEREWEDWV
jgi:hypothetical protein